MALKVAVMSWLEVPIRFIEVPNMLPLQVASRPCWTSWTVACIKSAIIFSSVRYRSPKLSPSLRSSAISLVNSFSRPMEVKRLRANSLTTSAVPVLPIPRKPQIHILETVRLPSIRSSSGCSATLPSLGAQYGCIKEVKVQSKGSSPNRLLISSKVL